MSESSHVNPDEFLSVAEPLLAQKNADALAHSLSARWTGEQLVGLLQSSHQSARKVAALSLGLIGCRQCLAPLARVLHDADPIVNQLAEHAIWSIWFRMGGTAAVAMVNQGIKALGKQNFDEAIECFSLAIQLNPQFAEAYNQRSTAFYLAERFDEAMADAKRATEIQPDHFGAWASLGNCYACSNEYALAIRAYERALSINPNLECLRESIDELRAAVG